MAKTFQFNPDRVAYYEAQGWKAYYDRKWLRVQYLIVGLCQEEFHIPFPMSLLAAYYTTRASLAWVPVDHDEAKVRTYLRKFYTVARRYSGLTYDVQRVADLEFQYFDVHRRLSGKPESEKQEFLQTLTDLHSTLFGLPLEQMQESAQWRLKAADIVDLITSHTSNDVPADWARLEEYLQRCYRSIYTYLNHRS